MMHWNNPDIFTIDFANCSLEEPTPSGPLLSRNYDGFDYESCIGIRTCNGAKGRSHVKVTSTPIEGANLKETSAKLLGPTIMKALEELSHRADMISCPELADVDNYLEKIIAIPRDEIYYMRRLVDQYASQTKPLFHVYHGGENIRVTDPQFNRMTIGKAHL